MNFTDVRLDCLESVDLKSLKIETRPDESHYDRVLSAPARVWVGGELSFVALEAQREDRRLLSAIRRVRFDRDARSSGLLTTSRTFGFLPRVTVRRDFCTSCRIHRQDPVSGSVLMTWAQKASGLLNEHMPSIFREQQTLMSQVKDEWRIPGSVFTSGILNKDNELAFHQDSGNFPGAWSCMYVFQRDTDGGLLVLPEARLAFSFQRPTVIMFDGARLVHGVTRIKKRSRDGYRYSCVFYALQGMKNCGTLDEELERIRAIKTDREIGRVSDEA